MSAAPHPECKIAAAKSVQPDVRRLVYLSIALAAAGSPAGAISEIEPPPDPSPIQLTPAPLPAQREVMRRWRRELRDPLAPVLREWESLARISREGPGSRLAAGCRRLDAALEALRAPLPRAPDPAVSLHLETTLRSLAEAAGSCTHGAYFLTAWRLREAAMAWRQLRGRLLLYGLSP